MSHHAPPLELTVSQSTSLFRHTDKAFLDTEQRPYLRRIPLPEILAREQAERLEIMAVPRLLQLGTRLYREQGVRTKLNYSYN